MISSMTKSKWKIKISDSVTGKKNVIGGGGVLKRAVFG